MPGAWPTLSGLPDVAGSVDVGRSEGATSSAVRRTGGRSRRAFGSIGRMNRGWSKIAGVGLEEEVEGSHPGVPYAFRRAALKGMFDDCDWRVGPVDVEEEVPVDKENTGVGVQGLSRQPSYECLSDTVDTSSDGQVTPDSIEDVDKALPPFPKLVTEADETDWAKYLRWMEDDMLLEERTNNNMLLTRRSIHDVSSDEVTQNLSLDPEPTGERRILLFKDLPAMRQGQHDGLAMYILGYDAVERVFFVRRFERLSSKIELLPRYWDCGKEVVWLSIGRVLQILRDIDLGDASGSHARLLPEWDEELGFKVVVVGMFAQWVLDFSSGFRMMEEVAEIASMLLWHWRYSLLTRFAGARASVHPFNEGKVVQRRFEEVDTTEERDVVHETLVGASPPIADAANDRRATTYDSDEEEEWAARTKLEKPLVSATAESAAEIAPSHQELSFDEPLRPMSKSLTPERAISPFNACDPAMLVNAKRFSDSSTLCDERGEIKESLAFVNAIRNTMLKERSIEAMSEIYLEYIKEHPEHDSEKKRSEFFEFLVAQVGEKDGGSLAIIDALQVLKKMGLAEGKEADGREVRLETSSCQSG